MKIFLCKLSQGTHQDKSTPQLSNSAYKNIYISFTKNVMTSTMKVECTTLWVNR